MDRALMQKPTARSAGGQAQAEAVADSGWPIRPALFSRYADLAALRHPYPMVLIDDDRHTPSFRPLMQVLNEVLAATAPKGSDGEATRQRVLRLEETIRRRVADGESGTLTEFWRSTADALVEAGGETRFGPMDTDFDRVREALTIDGRVIGCTADTPGAIIRHVWGVENERRAQGFRKKVDGLLLALSDIVKADFAKSDDAHEADSLRQAIGETDRTVLDFHALSRMLVRQHPEERIPADRFRRIEWAILVLNAQRFFEPGRTSQRSLGKPEPHGWVFDGTTAALDAFRERLPEMLEFVKALTIAELEVESRYVPEVHDPIIAAFDESDLTDAQMALLPVPLVCLRDGTSGNAELVRAFEALASGLPFKLLIQTDDILGHTTPEPPQDAFGGGSARLAAMAMGLGEAFVLQVSAAHLSTMAGQIERGMRYDGPGLFCIYSGATETVPDVAPYLLAAAATESRAFPSFAYDPSAGPDWARRFDLGLNPQVGADWPERALDYEDSDGQRQHLNTRFSVADFIIADTRYRRFCRPRKTGDGTDGVIPAADWLELAPDAREKLSPGVPGLAPDDRLWRVVLDDKIMGRADSARQVWRSLCELAGIRNSHVERALAEARARLSDEAAQGNRPEAGRGDSKAGAQPPVETATDTADAVKPPAEPEAGAGSASDGLPWIESARCTSCNECTQINNALFVYNDNAQAYIADPRAGTYRELVEAAESCQVSIIHPGQPLNPDEPDLEKLIDRAAPFN